MPPRTKRAYARHIDQPAQQGGPPPVAPETPQGQPAPTPMASGPLAVTRDLTAPAAPSTNGHVAQRQAPLGFPRKADGTIDYDKIDFAPDEHSREVSEAEEIRADLVSQVAGLVAQGQQANPALEHFDPESIDKKIKVSRIRRGQEMSILFFRMVMATIDPSEQKRFIPITLETMLSLTIGAGGLGIEDRLKVIISQIRSNAPESGQG